MGGSRIHEPGVTESPGEFSAAGGLGGAGFSGFGEHAAAMLTRASAIRGRHFIGKTFGPEEGLPTLTCNRPSGQTIA